MKTFDVDPLARIHRGLQYDEADDSIIIETKQDTTPVVEAAKASFNQFDERTPWKGDMHRVASIPMTVYMDLVKRGIANDEKAFRRWLDDSDNAVFRTRPGKLSR